jgi:hypothetical protein
MRNIGPKIGLTLGAVLLHITCVPAGLPLTEEVFTDTVTEQASAVTPEGTGCHAGKFQCANGPELTECGTWYFDMTDADTVIGFGEITGVANGPISVVLSGVIDKGVQSYPIVLTSDAGGSGEITLVYDGPELELGGTWSFTDAPEPEGTLYEGGVVGTSCVDLR